MTTEPYDPSRIETWPAETLAAHLAWLASPGSHTFSTCWRCGASVSRGGRDCKACCEGELARRSDPLAALPDDWPTVDGP